MASLRSAAPPPPAPFALGSTIDAAGRYEVRNTIGKGGFGEAYLVFDRQLNRFCVAKRQMPNAAWSERTRQQAALNFQREAQLLVTLNTPGHPNIPEIYAYLPEQSCLVMKYVEGRDLSQLLRERGGSLPPNEALAITREVASALAYMHTRPEPVLHRDVKPANIIIDSAGRVWLIDFGLSRATPVQAVSATSQSQLAGTLGFTPPEQWRGQAQDRSDVYALAATLHMLLTGHQPALTKAELPEFLKGAKQPHPLLRTLKPGLHPDVESLVSQALAFNPAERPSAADLLAAIEKILAPTARAPLQAPDGSAIADEYALVSWAEAHWDLAAAWLYQNLPDQVAQLWGRNKLASDMRAAIEQNSGDQHAGLDDLLALLDPDSFGAERPRLVADRRALNFGSLALDERRDEWVMFSNAGRRYARVSIQAPRWAIPSTLSLSLPPGRKQRVKLTADMRRVNDSGQLRDTLLLKERSGVGFRVELQAQLSRWRAFWLRTVAGQRGLDWETGQVRTVRVINAHRGGVWALDFGPGGLQLASGGWDHAVRIWRSADGSLAATIDEQAGNVLSTNFSPDGLLIAATSSDSDLKVWGARGGKLIRPIRSAAYQESAFFSPDSQVLISNGSDATITYWRLSDGAAIQRVPTVANAVAMAVHPDGQRLAVGCGDRRVRLYDGETGALTATLEGHNSGVSCVAYSLDGSLLASGSADGTICLWDGESGELRQQLRGHQNNVRTVAVHPDGLLVASGGVDGTIRLWRTTDGAHCQTLVSDCGGVLRITFSPTGELLAVGGGDGTITFWQPS
ncbi:MAG: WD40 repeat domain-containing serine/threonine protein kinase [Oscillochloridaceae bacterium umkhey_bin13]